jgi:hypothetical protein
VTKRPGGRLMGTTQFNASVMASNRG